MCIPQPEDDVGVDVDVLAAAAHVAANVHVGAEAAVAAAAGDALVAVQFEAVQDLLNQSRHDG